MTLADQIREMNDVQLAAVLAGVQLGTLKTSVFTFLAYKWLYRSDKAKIIYAERWLAELQTEVNV